MHDDIDRAAAELGIEPAALLAIAEVASGGAGFLPCGRPTILFDRVVMFQRLKAAGCDAAMLFAKFPALVNPEAGGHKDGAQELYRLKLALQIDPATAEECARWGLFQQWGHTWQACGFDSIAAFVAAMTESEARQIDAFAKFVGATKGLSKAIKACKWDAVAKACDFPDASNRLAAAYERHAGAQEEPA